jgi:glycine C-acetyltransferase
VNFPAVLKFFSQGQNNQAPVNLIDLSRHGAKISSRTALPDVSTVKLFFKTSADLACALELPGHLEPLARDSGNFIYTLNFVPLEDMVDKQLQVFLESRRATTNRRQVDRRQRKGAQKLEGRLRDRRLKLGTLTKSVRYARLDYFKSLRDKGSYVYLRPLQGRNLDLYSNNKKIVSYASNDYLGLSTHPEVVEASIKALEKYGLTSASSRLLGGTYDLHLELEEKLAKFKNGDSCLLFNTGYTTNLSVIFSLIGKEDVVLVDEKAHASIMDGLTMAQAQVNLFLHNKPSSLKRLLVKFAGQNKIIIVDGVYSMDGDICFLDQIYALAQEFNTPIMIDDAHGTGVLGKEGKGTSEHFGLTGKIDIEIGTLSKGLGAMGGFIVASEKIIDFLKYTGRTFIFSVSMPAAITAGVLKSLELLQTRPRIKDRLWANTKYMLQELQAMGYNTSNSETPIIPIVIGDESKTYAFSKALEDENIIVGAVAWPAVKKRESRLRITIRANHAEAELEQSLQAFKKIGKKLNLI